MELLPYTFEQTYNKYLHARTHARSLYGKIKLELSIILDTTLSILLITGSSTILDTQLSNKLGA